MQYDEIAKLAKEFSLNYFDLTEDTHVAAYGDRTFTKRNMRFCSAMWSAPGFISIVANHLMQHFPTLDSVKMRVGALPTNISNALQYSLTCSTHRLD